MSNESDGRPVPGSQPMSKQTAEWYVAQTNGALQAFLHEDGNWYLYAPKPVPVGLEPKIPIGEVAEQNQ
jgi:hypothetical protein